MAKSKKVIRFTLKTAVGKKFEVGKVARFHWEDLFYSLRILNGNILNHDTGELLSAMLNSSRELIHKFLWNLIPLLENDPAVDKDVVQAAGWVVACYGYIHGLKCDTGSAWPHPAPLQRKKLVVVPDWRKELKCPVCFRNYRVPKSFRTKEVILRHFGVWLKNHFVSVKH